MIVSLFAVAVIGYAVICLAVAMVLSLAARPETPRQLDDPPPTVSVIVCARNEEAVIARCIEGLRALDYPLGRIEIVLVDDESEDGTLAIMRRFEREDARIMVRSTAGEPDTLAGKQRPLNLGVNTSTGEFILVTDADTVIEPGWVHAHLGAYGPDTGMVGGITTVAHVPGHSLSVVQDIDQRLYLAVAAGFARLGGAATVMSNNVSFRREACEMAGGIAAPGATIVEDVRLLYGIVRNTPYRLGWTMTPMGRAVSDPLGCFAAFLEQRARMMTVFTLAPFPVRALAAGEVLLIWLSAIALVTTPSAGLIAMALWCLATGTLARPNMGWRTIPAVVMTNLFRVWYGHILIARHLFAHRPVRWKGRECRETT